MVDENRIKETIKKFSFPRLSGTEGEEKALKLAVEGIEDLNLTPLTQDFVFSTFFGRMYPKLAFFLGSMVLFLFYLNIVIIIIPILLLVIGGILGLLFILALKPEAIRLPKRLNSSNLYVKINSKEKLDYSDIGDDNNLIPERSILFMCHLDSKGQRFSILYRIRIIRTWGFSGIIVLVIIIIKNLILTWFPLILYVIGVVPIVTNLVSAIIFLFNTTDNRSPGAIDNASGIACVFELLFHYSNQEARLKNYDIWFIFTGTEECGTMGIRNFYQLIKNFNKKESIIFNFDSIAKSMYFFPDRKTSNQVNTIFNMFVKNNRELMIKTSPIKLPFGSHTDGYYLKKKGFHGIGFGDLECYEYIHSIHDTVDKVDASLLKRLCETIIDNLIVFDNQI